MLRSAAISRIQQGLGFRTDLTTVIISALQEAQRDLEGAQTLPWFLINESQSLAVTLASQVVALPTGFLRIVEDEQPYFTLAGDTTFLEKKPFDEAKIFYSGTDPGTPAAYTLRSASMTVWPVPDANYTLTWSFYARGTLLDGEITNTWLTSCPELLIGLAGLLVAADLENEMATKKFGAMYQKWDAWLQQEITARDEQGNARALGRNH
jgi:hypothetical protein